GGRLLVPLQDLHPNGKVRRADMALVRARPLLLPADAVDPTESPSPGSPLLPAREQVTFHRRDGGTELEPPSIALFANADHAATVHRRQEFFDETRPHEEQQMGSGLSRQSTIHAFHRLRKIA